MFDRLRLADLTRHPLLASGELVDITRHPLLPAVSWSTVSGLSVAGVLFRSCCHMPGIRDTKPPASSMGLSREQRRAVKMLADAPRGISEEVLV